MSAEADPAGIATATNWLRDAQSLVVFTGAGISTESGIPDFRSPGGIWTKYKPIMYQDFVRDPEARRAYWARSKASYPQLAQAEPNAAHRAVAQLAAWGKLDLCITQNIDGLHQKAGLADDQIVELHGNALSCYCLECGQRYDRADVQQVLESGQEVPECDNCGGIVKSATVSFGQPMPERETALAMEHSRRADLFLVIGSSLVVYPAAQCPILAKQNGARVVILNRDETEHDSYADLTLHATAGPTMQRIIDGLAPSCV